MICVHGVLVVRSRTRRTGELIDVMSPSHDNGSTPPDDRPGALDPGTAAGSELDDVFPRSMKS